MVLITHFSLLITHYSLLITNYLNKGKKTFKTPQNNALPATNKETGQSRSFL